MVKKKMLGSLSICICHVHVCHVCREYYISLKCMQYKHRREPKLSCSFATILVIAEQLIHNFMYWTASNLTETL